MTRPSHIMRKHKLEILVWAGDRYLNPFSTKKYYPEELTLASFPNRVFGVHRTPATESAIGDVIDSARKYQRDILDSNYRKIPKTLSGAIDLETFEEGIKEMRETLRLTYLPPPIPKVGISEEEIEKLVPENSEYHTSKFAVVFGLHRTMGKCWNSNRYGSIFIINNRKIEDEAYLRYKAALKVNKSDREMISRFSKFGVTDNSIVKHCKTPIIWRGGKRGRDLVTGILKITQPKGKLNNRELFLWDFLLKLIAAKMGDHLG